MLITKGPHKGAIGYYDDDDGRKLIIYPDSPIRCNEYYLVNRSAATSVIPTKSLANRWKQIDQILYENCFLHCLTAEEENLLLREKTLCADTLTNRYLQSMQKIQSQDKAEIFISHSSLDLAFSRAIATDLMDAGFSVFLDDWSIDIGERIFEKINSGLNESKAFIMIISKDYLSSICCTDEWGAFYGKALHDPTCALYPIIIDDSEPPRLLSQIKYLRISDNNYSESLLALLRALAKHFNKQ